MTDHAERFKTLVFDRLKAINYWPKWYTDGEVSARDEWIRQLQYFRDTDIEGGMDTLLDNWEKKSWPEVYDVKLHIKVAKLNRERSENASQGSPGGVSDFENDTAQRLRDERTKEILARFPEDLHKDVRDVAAVTIGEWYKAHRPDCNPALDIFPECASTWVSYCLFHDLEDTLVANLCHVESKSKGMYP